VTPPLPTLSVIIAARPDQAEVLAADAARRLDYPPEKLQILVARGRQPSVQRNTAARQARGEWIYFLDDDSVAPSHNLQQFRSHASDPRVVVVGGPSLCPPDAPRLEHAFAAATANSLAFGPSAARYQAQGSVRDSNEKELILCNLFIRRDAFLAHGGFDEALYPNEENALMDALLKSGSRLVYDPDLWVLRRPRHSLKAFTKMVFTYGRGRAEQVRRHPSLGSLINLVPSLFCLYLAALPWLPRWSVIGLAAYAIAVLSSVFKSSTPPKTTPSSNGVAARPTPPMPRAPWWSVAPLIVLTHLGYGLGFWRGLVTRLGPSTYRLPIAVQIEERQP